MNDFNLKDRVIARYASEGKSIEGMIIGINSFIFGNVYMLSYAVKMVDGNIDTFHSDYLQPLEPSPV